MKPGWIHGATRALGASGQMDYAWYPSDEEKAAIAAGRPVIVTVWGVAHPPLSVNVQAPTGEAAQGTERVEFAAYLESMSDAAGTERERVALSGAALLLRMGSPIPPQGCGCRVNGVPVMRANCSLHQAKQ